MWTLKLKFMGPNVAVGNTTTVEPLKLGQSILLEVKLMAETMTLSDAQRFWEMERAFNELTKGRLHIEIES